MGRARRFSELVGFKCLVRILIKLPISRGQLERMELTVVEWMEFAVVEAA